MGGMKKTIFSHFAAHSKNDIGEKWLIQADVRENCASSTFVCLMIFSCTKISGGKETIPAYLQSLVLLKAHLARDQNNSSSMSCNNSCTVRPNNDIFKHFDKASETVSPGLVKSFNLNHLQAKSRSQNQASSHLRSRDSLAVLEPFRSPAKWFLYITLQQL